MAHASRTVTDARTESACGLPYVELDPTYRIFAANIDLLLKDPTLILACTLFGEARSAPVLWPAIYWVIRNRRFSGPHRGDLSRPASWICLRLRQFSCWNPGDQNRLALGFVIDAFARGSVPAAIAASDAKLKGFDRCYQAVLDFEKERPRNPIGAHTHYFREERTVADWTRSALRKGVPGPIRIAGHIFTTPGPA